MSVRSDTFVEINSLSAVEKSELHFRQICRRIMQIHMDCHSDNGCPAKLVAIPVIRAWNEAMHVEFPEQVTRTIRYMLEAGRLFEDGVRGIPPLGHGTSCPILEIKRLAADYLVS